MRMKKFLTLGATLALMLGFASCQNEKNQPSPVNGQDVDTYVGVSVKFPTRSTGGLKALPEDYNKKGEWQGRDLIKKIKVYVVTKTGTTYAINSTSFSETSFNAIQNNGVLTPNLAVLAKAGDEAYAYVVINDEGAKVTSILDGITDGAEFAQKFKEAVASVNAINEVAKYDNGKEIVLMTNKVTPVATNIVANITEDEAKNGTANRMDVEVSRVASRAIVTIDDAAQKKIEVKRNVTDAAGTTTTSTVVSTVNVTKVSYQVTGSALKFNVLEDRATWMVPNDVYGYLPTGNVKGANDYDWSNLTPSAAGLMLHSDAEGFKDVTEQADNTDDNLKAALAAEQHSKFVLPVTHADGNYRKGNVSMFEIKAQFTVDKVDGVAPTAEGQTVYMGLSDGLFYSTADKAKAMDKDYTGPAIEDGKAKQEIKTYTNSEMYYYIWLNPDVPYDTTGKITKSPTVRNQVYHAHITGFGEMGLTGKGDLPPDEVLETDKTHLSVALKVLPWTMHSYKVNLTNRY